VLYELDPCKDTRWLEFLDRRPDASVFHTPGWIEALQRTYRYEPIAYTTSAPGKDLTNGHVFCRVSSWLTGRRLVSLPFSDHAALLMNDPDDFQSLLFQLCKEIDDKKWKYVELRPVNCDFADPLFRESSTFCWHRLPLDRDLDALFRGFHKSCVQRKIRRAIREKLEYTEGRSDKLIHQFYHLLGLTQRRHNLPPQPVSWFKNLSACLGESLRVRIASKNGKPVAGMITLSFKQTMSYKYGCSDAKYHKLGGMPFLFWKTIQDAKACGLTELDMGRSDLDNPGLIAFKEHWGAKPTTLKYWRYPFVLLSSSSQWELKAAKKIFAFVPTPALTTAGRLLYRHVG